MRAPGPAAGPPRSAACLPPPAACPPPTHRLALCRWLPGTAKFLALGCYARGTGTLQLYELDGAALELAAETEQPASLKCACVLGGGGETGSAHQQLIALGNFDGQLQLVDAERLGSSSEPLWRVQTHAGVVNGLDAFNGQVGAELDSCGQMSAFACIMMQPLAELPANEAQHADFHNHLSCRARR